MRIISGKAGGIALQVPKGEVRPTTDRVREALFSILGDRVPSARVLDLFAGSGALSLEALSRGASQAVMVDASRSSCDTIRKNLAKSKLNGASLHMGDAVSFAKKEVSGSRKYDLIFADPPYCKGPADRDFIKELASTGIASLLSPDGLFIAEVQEGWGTGAENESSLEGLDLIDTRRYGKNMILLYTQTSKEAP